MIDIKPREYQEAIVNTAKQNNTLVVLPTGLGKTLIALLLTIDRQKAFPGSKAIFLAPTRPLVEQHYNTFTKQLPELFATQELFTGSVNATERKKRFQRADIIFSTPQCISNDLKSGLYTLDDTSLLIIDEAHRCLKNYAYTTVVDYYKRQSENQRILGLTASPGSESSKIKEICQHLDIQEIEVKTRDSEDVKPYLQELEFQKVEVPFPVEFQEIKVLLERIYNSAISKLREINVLFGPANKITLLKLQKSLSPRVRKKDIQAIIGISVSAQAIKISHALELLETQTLSGLEEYFQSMIKQAEEKKSKAVQQIVKSPNFNAARISLQQLLAKKIEHPKIEEIKVLVEEEFSQNENTKIIIFSQFRETAATLAKRLSEIPRAKPAIFLGQAKKKTSSGTSGLNQKEQKKIIQEFRDGEKNILCATSIAEEGLDIPEVSAVIFYEPIPSAIRKIQRAGRTARLSKGKLLIMITKDTRDVAYHYASAARERKMYKTLEQVKKDLKEKTLLDYK